MIFLNEDLLKIKELIRLQADFIAACRVKEDFEELHPDEKSGLLSIIDKDCLEKSVAVVAAVVAVAAVAVAAVVDAVVVFVVGVVVYIVGI